MTTPVTTSEPFTLTGVFSRANAGSLARMTKAAINKANRETIFFIRASRIAKTLPFRQYCLARGGRLSVISDHLYVISNHNLRIRRSRPCQGLAGGGRSLFNR